jgi:hypothetical protein
LSLLDQWNLTFNDQFISRVRTAIHNEAMKQIDSNSSPVRALAEDVLRGSALVHISAFVGYIGATPGFADKLDITDAEIVTAVVDGFPIVANLFYTATGNPKP